ncbi:filamentous hemagglutinin N-terminal domain-containing protein [Utexia brackfieldae]|uniref:two-partner secretion domain-containing protein n=1 Tax=Utexia brackfieldae TaxID=3074108 RepID=UPI00370D97F9
MNNKHVKKYFRLLYLVTISILFFCSGLSYAEIVLNNGNTIMTKNVPVFNINEANVDGVSHNIYREFNVGEDGLIFNNSQKNVNTQSAEQISANRYLANGSAKLILNEIQSSTWSNIEGKIEVIGDKASVIIINPAGIYCNGCQFINTDSVTLSTGNLDINPKKLMEYPVSQGVIKIDGAGFTSDSSTTLLSHSVVINSKVDANELTIAVGNHYMNIHNQVTRTLQGLGPQSLQTNSLTINTAIPADKTEPTDTQNAIRIKNSSTMNVSDLSPLFATQETFSTSPVSSQTNEIASATNYHLDNVRDKESYNQPRYNDTASYQPIGFVSAASLSSIKVYSSPTQQSDANAAAVAESPDQPDMTASANIAYDRDKSVVNAADDEVTHSKDGEFHNVGGTIQGYSVTILAPSIDNTNGVINGGQGVQILTSGDITNTNGLIRSQSGRVKLVSSQGVIDNMVTKQGASVNVNASSLLGIIAASSKGGIDMTATRLKNTTGQIISLGDLNVQMSKGMNNKGGRIQAGKKLNIKAYPLDNKQGSITSSDGVNLNIIEDQLVIK